MKKITYKKNLVFLVSIFVFAIFAYMTYQTPLAGDDWGYALNGASGNPVKMALSFYQSWSGRFFSELWGMVVPGHKYLWNVINPLLFTGIFVLLCKLGNIDNHPFIGVFFVLAFMLSVDDNLRMETYTWIMGTTYIVPLLFSLLYFRVTERMINDEANGYGTVLVNGLLFVIGLMMENIAATMVGSIMILIIYDCLARRKVNKHLLTNLLFSSVSFIIMRISPGSAFRLMNDNASWAKLSLIEKISKAYPNFLQMTFINNNYAILLFSIVLGFLVVFSKRRMPIVIRSASMLVLVLGIVSVFSFVLGNSIFNDCSSVFSLIFWPIYIVNAFATLWLYIDDEYLRNKSTFFLIVAGANALVMLYSPIYGSRSAIYTVYYLIVVSLIVMNSFCVDKKYVLICAMIVLSFIILDRTSEYITKYHLVGIRNRERLEVIEYYREHPEDEEAWIPRFPIFSIHGADIEIGDTYHFETFKDYYGLPQSADKIIFYFVEDN